MQVGIFGQGADVVLLHGVPSSIRYFDALRDALAVDHRVLIPELPGYGRTPKLEADPSVARVQRLLEDALVEHGVRDAAIVGHSFGGYRALGLALSATRLTVRRVVTLGSFAGLDEPMREGFRAAAKLLREGTDPWALFEPRAYAPGFERREPAKAAEVKEWITALPPAFVADELEAVSECADLRPRLGTIRAEVLAIAGALDVGCPPACSEEIARGVPGGRVEVVPGAGHAVLYEGAGVVDAVVLGLDCAQLT